VSHLRYEQHTWEELRELGRRDDVVVVIPTATLEDHGYHLPIDTDVRLAEAVARGGCERANAAGPGHTLLFPTAVHGYTPITWTSRARSASAGTCSSSTCSISAARSAATASIASWS
jgi:creatinine amidohydrolase